MRWLVTVELVLICLLMLPASVGAAGVPWGTHLLEPSELPLLIPLRTETGPLFVTVPMALSDRRTEVWETFFETAFKAGITPMVRWVTRFNDGAWQIPTRKEIIEACTFLSSLNWPGRRVVILFNEPNHAKEWGDSLDPESYVEVASFAAAWLKTEKATYEILPAGLDAAAPNGKETMDNLRFMDRMYAHRPDFFDLIDGWTSHSYPNPGFSSTPYRRTKDSMWGFDWELRRLKTLTDKDFSVFITETGWKQSRMITRVLPQYYQYTVDTIWSDPRVKAVTVFVLRGFNGPFAEFSLLDADGNQSVQMQSLLKAVK